ncbi:MAG: GNAT family N-acetyltransferase [Pseudomonadota bacterium]
MTLRPAVPADIPAMADLARAAYARYVPRLGGAEPPAMRPDFDTAIETGCAWVVDADEGLAAYLLCAETEAAWVIDNLAVAPTHQGYGLGRRLLDMAEDEGRRRGFTEVRLLTNLVMTENQAIYAARGYRETARETILGGSQTRLHYAKPLSAAAG